MTPRFMYVPVDSLPPLAWCTRVRAGPGVATVFHGRSVETAPEFFAEAAWNGGFTGPGLRAATVVCGTGATCDAGRFTFHASTDGQSPLFSVRMRDVMHISNSPGFALAAAGQRPDPLYPFYYHGLVRIYRGGFRGANGFLPTAAPGVWLGVHFHAVLRIGTDLAVTVELPEPGDEPRTWEAYKLLVDRGVRDVIANACDGSRRLHYRPLAQISRGYDSAATAALAAEAGCQEAVTIHDSRADDPGRDGGEGIARVLGMGCRVIDRWGHVQRQDPVEAEFAFPSVGAIPAWSELERDLAGRLVVSGTHGDFVWELTRKQPLSDELERPSETLISGLSGLEFRLRTGYLPLAPATIGMRHSQAIVAIGRSPELRHWSVGGAYDRPIPRRIVEECGVPRSSFGMTKFAGGFAQFYRPADFSPAGLREYDSFRALSHATLPADRLLATRLMCTGEQAAWHCLHGGRRRSAIALRFPWQPVALTVERHTVPWRFRFLFQWACESLASRYQLPDVDGRVA